MPLLSESCYLLDLLPIMNLHFHLSDIVVQLSENGEFEIFIVLLESQCLLHMN